MERENLNQAMVLIAVSTPAAAGLIALYARAGALSMPGRGRMLALGLAGPLNLVAWLTFNRYLDGVENRQSLGIAIAAVVFIGLGLGLGWFKAVAGRAEAKRIRIELLENESHDPERPKKPII